MKKLFLALVLIAAFCLIAVAPVVAAAGPYDSVNISPSKYGLVYNAGYKDYRLSVTFPSETYIPSSVHATTLGKATTGGLDKAFAVTSMPLIKTSMGGYPWVPVFPWEL